MRFREATIDDIPQIQVVRNAVKENMLPDPSLVSDEDCKTFLTIRGKGWVCEIDDAIAGFAIIDLADRNIWALFVDPQHEQKGIGKKLQDLMLNWYFSQYQETLWLGTAPGTRAEGFYRRSGWKDAGRRPNGEIRFKLSFNDWQVFCGIGN